MTLEQGRNRCAEELQLDPTLIASRATLVALAFDWDEAKGDLMEWQRTIGDLPGMNSSFIRGEGEIFPR